MNKMGLAGAAFVLMGASATHVYAADALVADALVVAESNLFDWSGIYAGVHGGYSSMTAPGDGCYDFTGLRGENGFPAPFDNAGDMPDGPGDGWFDDMFNGLPGCQPTELDGNGDPQFPTFNLDGDYVVLAEGFDGATSESFFLGGQVGINHQMDSAVLGLEADLSWFLDGATDVGTFQYWHDGSWQWDEVQDFEGEGVVTSTLDWLATFRGRAGMAMGDEGRFLGYVTAGLAVGQSTVSGSYSEESSVTPVVNNRDVDWCQDGCYFGDDQIGYQVGHALGVGGEYAVTDNISIGAEYLYVGFWNAPGITFYGDDGRSFDMKGGVDSIHTIKAKVNFHFD